MALQASGQISLDDLHVEAGGTTGTECSMNDADIRDIISKGDGAQNSISEYYGQSSAVSGAWLGYYMRLPDGNLSWNAPLSTPAANRYIVVYSAFRTATSSSVSCTVNIAGQSVTRLANLSVSSSNRTAGAQVDIALVPTGTTGTISMSTSSGSVYQAATAWVMYGINPTYASFAQSNALDANVSINVQEGDMVIAGAGAGYANSTSSSVSWTGVTRNFTYTGNENNERHMSAGTHFVTADQSPRTIIADRNRSDNSRSAFAMAFR
tara:strand:- start:195 stop:992 length:798 start_codon:yes stop_codon:yes gene_type:complete